MLKFIFKLILVLAVIVVIGGVFVLGASGLWRVPWLTAVLRTDRPKDLGIVASDTLFTELLAEQSVNLHGDWDEFCLDCDMTYSDPSPMSIAVNSEQLTAYLQATNRTRGPLRNIQIKLADDNYGEMSAWLDVAVGDYRLQGPVYANGSFAVTGERELSFAIDQAKFGLLPVPANYVTEGEAALADLVNSQLRNMTGLRIESLSVDTGVLTFQGDFPHTITAD